MAVKPKKHLGQHFLVDENIARKISETLQLDSYNQILEIGPGMGVLTKYLVAKKECSTAVIEIDRESVSYLKNHYDSSELTIVEGDFLKLDVPKLFDNQQFRIVGNFPYNISSQILFRLIDFRSYVPELSGMFQKEVAERVSSKPGSKTYGILSVLVQAYYDAEYLFTVSENVFNPPPRVKSGVFRLVRKKHYELDCDEKLFKRIVKTAFNQRRKMLRSSLKSLGLPKSLVQENNFFNKRPEQLHVDEFVNLTKLISFVKAN